MMTKKEHISFWINSSDEDWITANSLLNSGRYVHTLFFAHLTLEKLCKAFWIRDNKANIPPKTHNLMRLISETNLQISDDQLAYLVEINKFQIQGRYPDYINNFQKICTQKYTKEHLNKIEELKKCLTEQMP